MSSLSGLSAAIALSLPLVACQSADQRGDLDEVKLVKALETVCEAQADVDSAMDLVNDLTPKSSVAAAQKAGDRLKIALSSLNKAEGQLEMAEVRAYRDQVGIFRKAVDAVSSKKDLTPEEAAEQLRTKAAPLLAARQQLGSASVCLDAEVPDAAADAAPGS